MGESSFFISAGAHAFGDGSHPTTAGMLAALEAIDPQAFAPRIACDIGCGSGIVAFSIIRFFHSFVIASDISPQAIETLKKNAKANGIGISTYEQGVKENLTPQPGSILPLQAAGFNHPAFIASPPFDLIAMNILAGPLLALAADAESHLAPGGALIVSGLLTWQEPSLHHAYQSLGLELASRLTLQDWVTQVWQKPE